MALYGAEITLHEKITEVLMDNGAAVTKKSIDAMLEFIAIRDQSIIDTFIRHSEKTLVELQRETRARNDISD